MKYLATIGLFFLCGTTVVAQSTRQPARITVLTYNIHHGRGHDGEVDLERIAKVIRQQKPDFVALQEVDNRTNRTGRVDQTAELARLSKMHGYFFKQIDFDGGEYGQAILSRFEAGELAQQMLPGTPEREQRLLGRARFEIAGHSLWLATTHLHHANARIREQQVEAINADVAQIATTDVPVILCGDFNAVPASRALTLISRAWKNSTGGQPIPTFPATKPARQIDYIFLRPAAALRVIAVKGVAEEVASDHSPLLVELEFSP